MLRVPFDEMYGQFLRVLLKTGFRPDRAELCARLFAEASRDGVATHGLNRFPHFLRTISLGLVDIHAEPTKVEERGRMEAWDGCRGPGNLNAHASMDRAVRLARADGMGCVALRNTNHWMRAGAYGWQAADAGCIAVCWTNGKPVMPPWGAREPRLGNNPLVIAVPRAAGHVVLDMAMSQFSLGRMEAYRLRGEDLPVPGGYDGEGNPTRDPAAIEASQRPLPIGYWKGSGLALMLDLAAALLSGGLASWQMDKDPIEHAESQVYIAFDATRPAGSAARDRVVDGIVDYVRAAAPDVEGGRVFYPGERTLLTRRENMEKGIPVEPRFWREVLAL